MRRYLLIFGSVNIFLFIALACFNWLVDPYRIFGAPIIDGFNNIKTRLDPNERIFKTVNLARQQPDVVLLGTSRTDIGLDPLHPIFQGKKSLNLAMSSQPYAETRMLVEHLDLKQTRQIIFGIDFFAANDLFVSPPSITPENFSNYRKLELLVSVSMLMDSFKTVRRVGQGAGSVWTEAGRRIFDDIVAVSGGNRRFFQISERSYLTTSYVPEPKCTFEFDAHNANPSPMENVRAIIIRAYHEDIDLRLFISPSHARQWETLAAAGLWDKWEEWKRRLATMNEEEAAKAGKTPFPIWDFSGYNSVSSEAVPAMDDVQNFMRNYFDSSHYTPAVGNLVLDRMFDYHAPDRAVPDDFGVRITSANLDAHLAHIRTEREHYRRIHPSDAAEIEALAKKVAAEKHCANSR